MLMLSSVAEANTITALESRLDRTLGIKLVIILRVSGQFECLNCVEKISMMVIIA